MRNVIHGAKCHQFCSYYFTTKEAARVGKTLFDPPCLLNRIKRLHRTFCGGIISMAADSPQSALKRNKAMGMAMCRHGGEASPSALVEVEAQKLSRVGG